VEDWATVSATVSVRCRRRRVSQKHASAPQGFCRPSSSGSESGFSQAAAGVSGVVGGGMVVGGVVYIYGPQGTPVEQIALSTSTPTYLTYTPSDDAWISTNAAGDETGYWGYDSFGNLAFGTPTSLFGYSGQYADATPGLVNDRSRWYQPQSGSFTTRDPAFAQTDTAYTYANGDPVNNSDPTGLWDSGACAGTEDLPGGCGWFLARVIDLSPNSTVWICDYNPSAEICSTGGGLGDFQTVLDDIGLAAGFVAVGSGLTEFAAGAAGVESLFGVSTETLGTVSTISGVVATVADAPKCLDNVEHLSLSDCAGFFFGAAATVAGAATGSVNWENLSATQGLGKVFSLAIGSGVTAWDALNALAKQLSRHTHGQINGVTSSFVTCPGISLA